MIVFSRHLLLDPRLISEKKEMKAPHGKTGRQTPHALWETHLRYCDEVRSEEDPRNSFQPQQIRCQRALAARRRTMSCRAGECAKVKGMEVHVSSKKRRLSYQGYTKKKPTPHQPFEEIQAGRGEYENQADKTRDRKKKNRFSQFSPGIPSRWFDICISLP